MAGSVVVRVDGRDAVVAEGSSLLEACDAAGRYVPRLCHHPAVPWVASADAAGARSGDRCGLCLVRLGDGSVVQACSTSVFDGAVVHTDDPELHRLRSERLAVLLSRHPHICLSCPDREGCTRDTCTQGVPVEARCCDQLGSCELGLVVSAVDPQLQLPRRAMAVSRAATTEGLISREPGLCVACGRCVAICSSAPQAGKALDMDSAAPAKVARPKEGTLRASGCTFCGLCVLVCPTGALTAPGAKGAKWLSARNETYQLPRQVLPTESQRFRLAEALTVLPAEPGVFTLFDEAQGVMQITGVADLRHGVAAAFQSPAAAAWVSFEVEPLYTQRETELLARHVREHGQLPPGNDLDDGLFDDDTLQDDMD
jgi:predicted molibdopterin-dependent oxidoreductase YjgC